MINFILITNLAFGIFCIIIKKESLIVRIVSIVQAIVIFVLNFFIILDISFFSLCCCCKKKDEAKHEKQTEVQIVGKGEKLLNSISDEVNILQALDDPDDDEKVKLLTQIKDKNKLREEIYNKK